jgi:pre-rRNA-processing protein TSR4
LLQAFAPIDGKMYDRIIYIFGCKNTSQCSKHKGSVKAIRAICKDPERVSKIRAEQQEISQKILDDKLKAETKQKLQIELTKDLFNTKSNANSNPFGSSDKANPFGSSDGNPFGSTDSNPFATKSQPTETTKPKESYAEVATKSAPKQKPAKKSNHSDLPSYNGSFVYVEKEKFKKIQLDPELEKYKDLIDKTDNESISEGTSESSKPALDANTSKISNMLDDKYFENFSNTVKHNPGQVLRYELGGRPLLYSGRDEVASKFINKDGGYNVPKPGYNPSSHRQFELQLMPKLIIDLENIDDDNVGVADILNGMSWGTIIVATDVEDFMPQFDENHVGYVEEWCGVQWEESV